MSHIESLDARHIGKQWILLRNKKYRCCYQFYRPLSLYEVQADDKLMLAHCTYHMCDNWPNELKMDRNIEALVYSFQLKQIVLATSNDMWRQPI